MGANLYQSNTTQNLVPLAPSAVGRRRPAAQQPQPYLSVIFCIALQGSTASFVTPSVEPAGRSRRPGVPLRVYAGTRATSSPLSPGTTPPGARSCVAVRRREAWYRDQFAGATVDIVTVDGEPAGVLCVDRGAEIRIVEIALVPERRGRGAGTALLRRARRGRCAGSASPSTSRR
jgi:hypothetical protein